MGADFGGKDVNGIIRISFIFGVVINAPKDEGTSEAAVLGRGILGF